LHEYNFQDILPAVAFDSEHTSYRKKWPTYMLVETLDLHESPYSAIHTCYHLKVYVLHCPVYDDLASKWPGKGELPSDSP
jgi:hypothetical protein